MISEYQNPAADDDPDSSAPMALIERPWIHLKTSHDVEAWINHFDWDLRRYLGKNKAASASLCFRLEQGGEIFLQTGLDGEILLDVTPDAQWVAPAIAAATGARPPDGQLWILPGDVLTQLVLGLSGLIASCKPVLDHPFNAKRRQRITW